MFWHTVVSYVAEVPDVVWSGVIASVITLSGVLLSNHSNTVRLEKQLAHDAEQKEKERLASLRKDVYLRAAEEVAKLGGYFAKLPSFDPTKVNLGDGLSEFLAVSAKVQLVANEQTVRLAAELTTVYAEIFSELALKATPIYDAQRDISLATQYYDQNISQVNRTLEEMRLLNESGQPDARRFAALQRSAESSQKIADTHAQRRSEAYERLQSANIDYQVAMLERMIGIGELNVKISAALRSEIGLSTDVSAHLEMLESNLARMNRSLNNLIEGLKEDNP